MVEIKQGDAYELIKALPDKSIDLIYTDVPYDEVGGGGGAFGSKRQSYHSEYLSVSGFDYSILDEFVRVMKYIYIYIWCNKVMIPKLIDYFVIKRNCIFDILTWHKTNPMPTCNNKYLTDTEYCLCFRAKGNKLYGTYDTKRTYYVTSTNKEDKANYKHPTIKPLRIVKNHIVNSYEPNKVIKVLDPFVGSGTTAVACQELGLDFIGFELK